MMETDVEQRRQLVASRVIQVDHLSASYGRGANLVQALRDVSLEIQAGEIFGLLGPNGAGKTTLLSCVEGLQRPDQGRVLVGGMDVSREPAAAQRKLGFQLQHTALLDDLTVAELVQVYSALYEVYLGSDQVSRLLEQFGVSECRNKLARRLSGGQRQRLALALAVANDPEIVLLLRPVPGDRNFAAADHTVGAAQPGAIAGALDRGRDAPAAESGGRLSEADGQAVECLTGIEAQLEELQDETFSGTNQSHDAHAPAKPLDAVLESGLPRLSAGYLQPDLWRNGRGWGQLYDLGGARRRGL
jgi:ABC-type lipoprotein export system ATPase subunit